MGFISSSDHARMDVERRAEASLQLHLTEFDFNLRDFRSPIGTIEEALNTLSVAHGADLIR